MGILDDSVTYQAAVAEYTPAGVGWKACRRRTPRGTKGPPAGTPTGAKSRSPPRPQVRRISRQTARSPIPSAASITPSLRSTQPEPGTSGARPVAGSTGIPCGSTAGFRWPRGLGCLVGDLDLTLARTSDWGLAPSLAPTLGRTSERTFDLILLLSSDLSATYPADFVWALLSPGFGPLLFGF